MTPEEIAANKLPKGSGKDPQLQVVLPTGLTIFNPNEDYSTPKKAMESATKSFNSPIPQRTTSVTHEVFLNMRNPKVTDFKGELLTKKQVAQAEKADLLDRSQFWRGQP